MKIEMRAGISGTRNGSPWPRPGQVVDLPEAEATQLCAQRLAIPAEETAVPTDDEESATPPVEETAVPADDTEVRTPDTRAVRQWAAEHGVDCPAKGRIPAAVMGAYLKAME